MTPENVLAAHKLAGLDRTVISNAVHYLRFCKTVQETVDALESSNRYLAKCRDENPDKFVAMATCVPGGGDECLKELERAVKQDDMRAVIINSSHQGHYPDEDAAKPFFGGHRPRHPGVRASGRRHHGRVEGLSAGVEHQPAG
jgi:predicted TIM-barrel fold metal-dependent hydrolase